MNPETFELKKIHSKEEADQFEKEGFIPIPKHLERAARLKLGKKKSVFVSKTSGGKLSKWAHKKKRQNKAIQEMVDRCNVYYAK